MSVRGRLRLARIGRVAGFLLLALACGCGPTHAPPSSAGLPQAPGARVGDGASGPVTGTDSGHGEPGGDQAFPAGAASEQASVSAADATGAELPSAGSASSGEVAPPYAYAESDDPSGTGKFFMGREIALPMSYEGAEWLERPDREESEQPEKLLDALELRPGDTVADLGAGTGYLTLRIARRVGPKGRVLAVEIQPEMLDLLAHNQKKAGLHNVARILGTTTDPKLPAGAVDLVLMVDVYHEFSHPVEMMRAIRRSLKPDGRVVFVEYRAEDPTVAIKPLHKMNETQVRREAEARGLKWQKTLDFLPTQHVVIFGKAHSRLPQVAP